MVLATAADAVEVNAMQRDLHNSGAGSAGMTRLQRSMQTILAEDGTSALSAQGLYVDHSSNLATADESTRGELTPPATTSEAASVQRMSSLLQRRR